MSRYTFILYTEWIWNFILVHWDNITYLHFYKEKKEFKWTVYIIKANDRKNTKNCFKICNSKWIAFKLYSRNDIFEITMSEKCLLNGKLVEKMCHYKKLCTGLPRLGNYILHINTLSTWLHFTYDYISSRLQYLYFF